MKLLLDTHTFIWWDSEPTLLSPTAFAVCSDAANELVVSTASVWEMQIKHQTGKLALRLPLQDILTHQQRTNAVVILPITEQHVLALDSLPTPHKDPFDRMLVAQAVSEGIVLISTDPIFDAYPVQVLW